MRIGELADHLGLNPQTIRYYHAIEVLPEPQRTASGYRVYGDGDLERLRFIRTAQRLGFALDEIREILAFRDRGEPPCPYVREVLGREVAELDRRIAEMAVLRDQLRTLQRRARRMAPDDGCLCPIIEHR